MRLLHFNFLWIMERHFISRPTANTWSNSSTIYCIFLFHIVQNHPAAMKQNAIKTSVPKLNPLLQWWCWLVLERRTFSLLFFYPHTTKTKEMCIDLISSVVVFMINEWIRRAWAGCSRPSIRLNQTEIQNLLLFVLLSGKLKRKERRKSSTPQEMK